jgi:hypothetical protein
LPKEPVGLAAHPKKSVHVNAESVWDAPAEGSTPMAGKKKCAKAKDIEATAKKAYAEALAPC